MRSGRGSRLDLIKPQPEVIRAITLEGSPCLQSMFGADADLGLDALADLRGLFARGALLVARSCSTGVLHRDCCGCRPRLSRGLHRDCSCKPRLSRGSPQGLQQLQAPARLVVRAGLEDGLHRAPGHRGSGRAAIEIAYGWRARRRAPCPPHLPLLCLLPSLCVLPSPLPLPCSLPSHLLPPCPLPLSSALCPLPLPSCPLAPAARRTCTWKLST